MTVRARPQRGGGGAPKDPARKGMRGPQNLTRRPGGAMGNAMPDRPEKKKRVPAPRMSYTTRVHMKRRLASIDFRFLAAVVALIVAAYLIIRYF